LLLIIWTSNTIKSLRLLLLADRGGYRYIPTPVQQRPMAIIVYQHPSAARVHIHLLILPGKQKQSRHVEAQVLQAAHRQRRVRFGV
jgi:hypothetical protein